VDPKVWDLCVYFMNTFTGLDSRVGLFSYYCQLSVIVLTIVCVVLADFRG